MDLVAFYIEIYIVRAMTKAAVAPYSLSVTDASARGISALVNDAEHGADIVVERRRQAIAVILSTRRLERLEEADATSAILGSFLLGLRQIPASALIFRKPSPTLVSIGPRWRRSSMRIWPQAASEPEEG